MSVALDALMQLACKHRIMHDQTDVLLLTCTLAADRAWDVDV